MTDHAATGDTATDHAATGDTATDHAATRDAATDHAATGDAATDHAAAGGSSSTAALTSAALPTRLHGSVVPLSPTTLWRWHRCRRLYLLHNLVQLPAVDAGGGAAEGLRIHAVLHQLHRDGSCHDREHVDGIVASYASGASGDEERLRGFLERHATRCPRDASYEGGEVALGRLHRDPPPVFAVSGKIDAVWIHDGLLDVRDYKTGTATGDPLHTDVRARAQAWMLAPLAARRRLRLRLRYEFLAPESTEDPPPWEPEARELATVDEELRATVEEIRAERGFVGVAKPAVCGVCEYRSICADAAIEPAERERPAT